MGCRKKRFKKTTLCAGDLIHFPTVQTRTLGTPGPDDTVPPLILTNLAQGWAGVTTVKPTAKFDGVNIEDRPTHIFTFRYDPALDIVEVSNHFLLNDNKLYRITGIKNNDENNEFLDIHCTERGISSQLAARA